MLAEEGHFRAGGLLLFVNSFFRINLHEGSLLSGEIEERWVLQQEYYKIIN